MSRAFSSLLGPCAALWYLAFAHTAHAEASAGDKAMSAQLFDDASKQMDAGNVAGACPKFAESNRLDPQLGTLLHVGECLERLGKVASAWAQFKDAAEIAEARGDARLPHIREHIASLEPKLSKLRISVASPAPGEEVHSDGELLGAAVWDSLIPIDPGVHNLTATATGRKSWAFSVQVPTDGGTVVVPVPELPVESAAPAAASAVPPGVAPAPAAAAAPPPPPAAAAQPALATTPPPASSSSAGGTQRVAGWVAVGAGAVGLGVGVVFELKRSSKLSSRDAICPSGNHCTQQNQDDINSLTSDARSAGTIGTVGLIAGAVLAAGGLTLVLTAPSHESPTAVSFTPVIERNFQGAVINGSLW